MGDREASAERHLRLLFEAAVDPLAPGRPGVRELAVAADALVAAGSVDAGLAAGLTADLELALALRRESPRHLPHRTSLPPGPGGERQPLCPRAVAVGPARLTAGGLSVVVTSITFGPDGASVHARVDDSPGPPATGRAATRRSPARSSRPGRAGPPPVPGGVSRRPSPRRRIAEVIRVAEQLTVVSDGGSVHRLEGGAGDSYALAPVPDPGVSWLEIALGDQPPVRLPVQLPRPALAGRAHGRPPGACWLAGALGRAAAGDRRPVMPGVVALFAAGALEPSDPLAHQAALIDGEDRGLGLDDRWRSPIERRGSPATVAVDLAIGAAVDLGDVAVRLDSLHAGPSGAKIEGWCSPWWPRGPGVPPVVLGAFDDRHNWYGVHPGEVTTRSDVRGEVTWRLAPELDPAAGSLRIDLTSREQEASVEVQL